MSFGKKNLGGIFLKPSLVRSRGVIAALVVALAGGVTGMSAADARADDALQTSIAGVVTTDGTPTSGVEVCAYVPQTTEAGDDVNAAGDSCITTDSAGAYSFSFTLAASTEMASVWAKTSDGGTWSAGASGRNISGYFAIAPGDAKTGRDIAIVTKTVDPVTPTPSPTNPTPVPAPNAAPAATYAVPTITGHKKVGSVLRAHVSWSAVATHVTYKWLRGKKIIKGAHGSSYRLTKKDRRQRISVVVTAKVNGQKITAKSSKTPKIAHR